MTGLTMSLLPNLLSKRDPVSVVLANGNVYTIVKFQKVSKFYKITLSRPRDGGQATEHQYFYDGCCSEDHAFSIMAVQTYPSVRLADSEIDKRVALLANGRVCKVLSSYKSHEEGEKVYKWYVSLGYPVNTFVNYSVGGHSKARPELTIKAMFELTTYGKECKRFLRSDGLGHIEVGKSLSVERMRFEVADHRNHPLYEGDRLILSEELWTVHGILTDCCVLRRNSDGALKVLSSDDCLGEDVAFVASSEKVVCYDGAYGVVSQIPDHLMLVRTSEVAADYQLWPKDLNEVLRDAD